MTVVLPLRRVLIAGLVPLLLCALLAFVLDARMAQGASPAPDPAILNCFATLGNSTQFSSADASAVQQAVDAAGPGALVKIAGDCAGVQARGGTTQTVYIIQPLILQGGYTNANWIVSDPVANPTVLDAKRLGGVVNAFAATDLSVLNLRVENGSSGISAGAHLTLSQVMVFNNSPAGGASATDTAFVTGSLVISNSDNLVSGGMNVGHFSGSCYDVGDVTVINSQFISNTGSSVLHCCGGGLYAYNTATVIGTKFIGNVGNGIGGGLLAGYLCTNNGARGGGATVIASQFIGNNGSAGGGGLFVNTLVMSDTQFISNTAGGGGGALAVVAATISGGLFQDNSAAYDGGGLEVSLGALVLTGTQFISNTAGQLGGGLATGRAATVSGALFRDNQCSGVNCLGGGLYVSNTLTVTDTQFLSNTAATAGGAVYANDGGSLHGSCIAGNHLAGVTNFTGTLNATNNWWGAVNGPFPIGSGDAISGTVNAAPFLTTPIFACPSLGFGSRLYLPIIVR